MFAACTYRRLYSKANSFTSPVFKSRGYHKGTPLRNKLCPSISFRPQTNQYRSCFLSVFNHNKERKDKEKQIAIYLSSKIS